MGSIIPYRNLLLLVLASVAAAMFTGNLLLLSLVPMLVILFAGLTKPVLIFFILLFTIPLSTEYQITTSLGTDLPDETLMWLLTPVILFKLMRDRKTVNALTGDGIMLLILMSLCWTFLSVLMTGSNLVSFKFLAAKIWYIVPFVIGPVMFLQQRKKQLQAAKILLLSMLIAVVVILVRHALNDFSFEFVNKVTAPFFRNHVNYGALLVCMIPLAWALFQSDNKAWLLVIVIFLVGLFFSYSRGAWLALGAGLLVAYFIRRNIVQWLIGTVAVLIFVGAAWFLDGNRFLKYRPQFEKTIYHASFDEHMAATYRLQDMSTIERFYRWIAAAGMAKEHWISGAGPNSFYPLYKSYVANDFRTYVSDNPEKSTVHNYFLLLLTEQGLPGLVLFIVLLVTMFLRAQKIFHNSKDDYTKGLMLVISSLLGMISVLIFLSDLIETDKIGSLFYLAVGLLVVESQRAGELARRSGSAADVEGIS